MADEDDTTTVDPIDNEVKQIIDEAKEEFGQVSLVDSIKNAPKRTALLHLGFDEVNSEKLTAIEAALGQLNVILDKAERNASGIDEHKKDLTKLKRELKKADADTEAVEASIADTERVIEQKTALLAEVAPLREQQTKLEAAAEEVRAMVAGNSLSVEVRAIPYSIARGAARRARKKLGITQKGIPEDLTEEFEEQQLLEIAYDQVVRWRDNRNGESGTKLDMELIEAMRDFLPMSQSAKFFNTVNDLQFRNAISESAIAQSDF
jgi:SMC interacting uncharacterized protein involved in chromosome segregation